MWREIVTCVRFEWQWLLIAIALPRLQHPAPREVASPGGAELLFAGSVFAQPGFAALFGVGMIDTAGRAGFLTFFPLALAAKGAKICTRRAKVVTGSAACVEGVGMGCAGAGVIECTAMWVRVTQLRRTTRVRLVKISPGRACIR